MDEVIVVVDGKALVERKKKRGTIKFKSIHSLVFLAIRRKKKEIAEHVRHNFHGESQYFSSQQVDLKKYERRQRQLNAIIVWMHGKKKEKPRQR